MRTIKAAIPVAATLAVLFAVAPAQAQTTDELAPPESGIAGSTVQDGGLAPDGSGYTTRRITFYCQQKNWLGMILWRYNSRWTWTHGRRGIIRSASHNEFASNLNLGWAYGGSRYLDGYGAVGTSFVGRSVQGHFKFQPGGQFVRSKYIVLRAGVKGIDPYVWGPWCLD